MPDTPSDVPESALDYDEIHRRGGAGLGDEDFVLLKCPPCGRIHLFDAEVDTVYPDPDDLGRRIEVPVSQAPACPSCGGPLRWSTGRCPDAAITRAELAAGPWAWVVRDDA